jgi:hypothetical protein
MLLCYVFPASAQPVSTQPQTTSAQQVPSGCSVPPTTFRKTWYIDPVNGKTQAAMTSAGVPIAQQGSEAHPWNPLQAAFVVTTGYTYPLLTTTPYRHLNSTNTASVFAPGPNAGPIEPGDEILLMS